MTDLRKAAEMALEAMEDLHRTGDTQVFDLFYADKVIPALRQALAMERFSEVSQEIEEALKQEPYPEGVIVGPCICGSWPGGECLKCKRIEQPKREWVGLTDEELKQTCYEAFSFDPYVIARATEAKLKEKNA
jgi:hypothetical protein